MKSTFLEAELFAKIKGGSQMFQKPLLFQSPERARDCLLKQ